MVDSKSHQFPFLTAYNMIRNRAVGIYVDLWPFHRDVECVHRMDGDSVGRRTITLWRNTLARYNRDLIRGTPAIRNTVLFLLFSYHTPCEQVFVIAWCVRNVLQNKFFESLLRLALKRPVCAAPSPDLSRAVLVDHALSLFTDRIRKSFAASQFSILQKPTPDVGHQLSRSTIFKRNYPHL